MIDSLCNDGDTMVRPDGRVLRLRLLPDDTSSINDYDADGSIEWTYNTDYGAVRPDHFTGRARIIDRDRGSCLWWEPPGSDIIGVSWDATTMRNEEHRIRELVRHGFQRVVLELCDAHPDAYGCLVVRESASVWGVEWNPLPINLATIVSELVNELERYTFPS
jgi:hypothetical protein